MGAGWFCASGAGPEVLVVCRPMACAGSPPLSAVTARGSWKPVKGITLVALVVKHE